MSTLSFLTAILKRPNAKNILDEQSIYPNCGNGIWNNNFGHSWFWWRKPEGHNSEQKIFLKEMENFYYCWNYHGNRWVVYVYEKFPFKWIFEHQYRGGVFSSVYWNSNIFSG